MGRGTSIEWCHATINAISGCTVVSPGCKRCYAMRAGRNNRPHHPSRGLTQPGPGGEHVWTGAVRLNEEWLKKPLKWAKPQRIFWNAHGDPFHPSVPQEWVDRELAIAALTPHHRHLILTKRSDRMRRYFTNNHLPERVLGWCRHFGFLPDSAKWSWPLPNVWLGVSIEDRKRMLERAPDLRATPAALHFWSAEPLLEDLGEIPAELLPDWIVAGGESGAGARPVDPGAFTSLRDQCETAGVPFLFKQWGEWIGREHLTNDQKLLMKGKAFDQATQSVRLGRREAGRLLDGKLHNAFPELFKWELEARRQPAKAPREMEPAA